MAKGQYDYRAPSRCSEGCGGCCVEVATNLPGIVSVRDSKSGRSLEFTPAEWADFEAAMIAGEYRATA